MEGGRMRAPEAGEPASGSPGPSEGGGAVSRLTRGSGWLLVTIGVAAWVVLGLVGWFREEWTVAWGIATAIGVGLALLLAAVAGEQLREWRRTRYRDVER